MNYVEMIETRVRRLEDLLTSIIENIPADALEPTDENEYLRRRVKTAKDYLAGHGPL